MKLYNLAISGNCYKVRLFLSVLKKDYEQISVNPKAGDLGTDEFLAMNPNGLVPVLVDGSEAIYDSAAILVYLARRYAPEHWFPKDPLVSGRVVRWLAFEQSEGRYGLARARAIALNLPSALAKLGTLKESQAIGASALDALNKQLLETEWLAGGDEPSIADIACYPYTALCGDGGLSLKPYPAVPGWTQRIERLDGYIPLPGR